VAGNKYKTKQKKEEKEQKYFF